MNRILSTAAVLLFLMPVVASFAPRPTPGKQQRLLSFVQQAALPKESTLYMDVYEYDGGNPKQPQSRSSGDNKESAAAAAGTALHTLHDDDDKATLKATNGALLKEEKYEEEERLLLEEEEDEEDPVLSMEQYASVLASIDDTLGCIGKTKFMNNGEMQDEDSSLKFTQGAALQEAVITNDAAAEIPGEEEIEDVVSLPQQGQSSKAPVRPTIVAKNEGPEKAVQEEMQLLAVDLQEEQDGPSTVVEDDKIEEEKGAKASVHSPEEQRLEAQSEPLPHQLHNQEPAVTTISASEEKSEEEIEEQLSAEKADTSFFMISPGEEKAKEKETKRQSLELEKLRKEQEEAERRWKEMRAVEREKRRKELEEAERRRKEQLALMQKKASDTIQAVTKVVGPALTPLLQVEKGVKNEAIRGASLAAFALALVTTHDIAFSLGLATFAAYVSVTSGPAGSALRDTGEYVSHGISLAQANLDEETRAKVMKAGGSFVKTTSELSQQLSHAASSWLQNLKARQRKVEANSSRRETTPVLGDGPSRQETSRITSSSFATQKLEDDSGEKDDSLFFVGATNNYWDKFAISPPSEEVSVGQDQSVPVDTPKETKLRFETPAEGKTSGDSSGRAFFFAASRKGDALAEEQLPAHVLSQSMSKEEEPIREAMEAPEVTDIVEEEARVGVDLSEGETLKSESGYLPKLTSDFSEEFVEVDKELSKDDARLFEAADIGSANGTDTPDSGVFDTHMDQAIAPGKEVIAEEQVPEEALPETTVPSVSWEEPSLESEPTEEAATEDRVQYSETPSESGEVDLVVDMQADQKSASEAVAAGESQELASPGLSEQQVPVLGLGLDARLKSKLAETNSKLASETEAVEQPNTEENGSENAGVPASNKGIGGPDGVGTRAFGAQSTAQSERTEMHIPKPSASREFPVFSLNQNSALDARTYKSETQLQSNLGTETDSERTNAEAFETLGDADKEEDQVLETRATRKNAPGEDSMARKETMSALELAARRRLEYRLDLEAKDQKRRARDSPVDSETESMTPLDAEKRGSDRDSGPAGSLVDGDIGADKRVDETPGKPESTPESLMARKQALAAAELSARKLLEYRLKSEASERSRRASMQIPEDSAPQEFPETSLEQQSELEVRADESETELQPEIGVDSETDSEPASAEAFETSRITDDEEDQVLETRLTLESATRTASVAVKQATTAAELAARRRLEYRLNLEGEDRKRRASKNSPVESETESMTPLEAEKRGSDRDSGPAGSLVGGDGGADKRVSEAPTERESAPEVTVAKQQAMAAAEMSARKLLEYRLKSEASERSRRARMNVGVPTVAERMSFPQNEGTAEPDGVDTGVFVASRVVEAPFVKKKMTENGATVETRAAPERDLNGVDLELGEGSEISAINSVRAEDEAIAPPNVNGSESKHDAEMTGAEGVEYGEIDAAHERFKLSATYSAHAVEEAPYGINADEDESDTDSQPIKGEDVSGSSMAASNELETPSHLETTPDVVGEEHVEDADSQLDQKLGEETAWSSETHRMDHSVFEGDHVVDTQRGYEYTPGQDAEANIPTGTKFSEQQLPERSLDLETTSGYEESVISSEFAEEAKALTRPQANANGSGEDSKSVRAKRGGVAESVLYTQADQRVPEEESAAENQAVEIEESAREVFDSNFGTSEGSTDSRSATDSENGRVYVYRYKRDKVRDSAPSEIGSSVGRGGGLGVFVGGSSVASPRKPMKDAILDNRDEATDRSRHTQQTTTQQQQQQHDLVQNPFAPYDAQKEAKRASRPKFAPHPQDVFWKLD